MSKDIQNEIIDLLANKNREIFEQTFDLHIYIQTAIFFNYIRRAGYQ